MACVHDDEEDDYCNIDDNPHLEQLRGCTVRKEYCIERILQSTAPRIPYRRRRGEFKSVIHWGQRKLLISEIEFLTKYIPINGEAGWTVVYMGAAPGTHLNLMTALFPAVHFILIDPSDFHISLEGNTNITIRNEYMTTVVARELSQTLVSEKVLIISDIRSVDYRVVDSKQVEDDIQRDMKLQWDCHLLMNPIAGIYKFRLPWDDQCSNYMNGDIYFPVWGPKSTTECRLIVDRTHLAHSPVRKYDHKAINEQMAYFNAITRSCAYQHDVPSSELDHCYDCTAEISILRHCCHMYPSMLPVLFPHSQLPESRLIDRFSAVISNTCNGNCSDPFKYSSCSSSRRGRSLSNIYHRKKYFERKYFDVVNGKILLLGNEEEKETNVSNKRPRYPPESQLASSVPIVSECNEVTSQISEATLQLLEKITATAETVVGGSDILVWRLLPEFTADDIEDDYLEHGTLGGSKIPQNTAVDIWLWNSLCELSDHTPLVTIRNPPPSPSTAGTVTAVDSTHDSTGMVIESIDLAVPSKRAVIWKYYQLHSLQAILTDQLKRYIMSPEAEGSGHYSLSQTCFIPVIVVLISSGCAYILPFQSILCFTESGEAQFFNIDCDDCTWSKCYLPTQGYDHHMTVVTAVMCYHNIHIATMLANQDTCSLMHPEKELILCEVIARNNQILGVSDRREAANSLCNNDWNFDSEDRLKILHHNGFLSISSLPI